MKSRFLPRTLEPCPAPLVALLLLSVPPAHAQAEDSAHQATIAELRAAVQALQTQQLLTQARIEELEAALARHDGTPASVTMATGSEATIAGAQTPSASATAPAGMPSSRLALSGDMRVRYESNFGIQGVRNRDRSVLRARLRAAYTVNDWLTVGGQLTTGDPDDPNSTDITLSKFDDDLHVSLDQAYIRLAPGNFQIHLGKIPQPFIRTELV